MAPIQKSTRPSNKITTLSDLKRTSTTPSKAMAKNHPGQMALTNGINKMRLTEKRPQNMPPPPRNPYHAVHKRMLFQAAAGAPHIFDNETGKVTGKFDTTHIRRLEKHLNDQEASGERQLMQSMTAGAGKMLGSFDRSLRLEVILAKTKKEGEGQGDGKKVEW